MMRTPGSSCSRPRSRTCSGIWRLLGPTARRRARRHPALPTRPASAAHAARAIHAVNPVTPATSIVDIGNGWRGGIEPPPTQVFADELLRFAGVGAVSTVAYLALFAALEPALGSYMANAVAIGLCSVGNTAAHRGMAGTARLGLDRPHRMLTAAALLGVSAGFTTGALATIRAMGWTSLVPELCAVSIANARRCGDPVTASCGPGCSAPSSVPS